MDLPIAEAESRLDELVRRAEAGEEVVLTRQGQAAVRLEPVEQKRPWSDMSVEERGRVLDAIRASGRGNAIPGPSAARSQDFLYDEDGLWG